jgi:hypothetical protein
MSRQLSKMASVVTRAPNKKASPRPATSSSRKQDWLLGFILFAAILAAYHSVGANGFIWDDGLYITHDPLLTAPDGLRRIWFSMDSPCQYFPMVYTVFRFEYALWGLNPPGYHWVNVILHAFNAILLWRLLRR